MPEMKTVTPDTTFPDTGLLIGADSQAVIDPSIYTLAAVVAAIIANGTFTGATLAPAGVSTAAYKAQSGIVITDATTARILSAGDNGKVIYFTSASSITLTTLTGLGAGFACTVIQGGAGIITVAQGASTTLITRSSKDKTGGEGAMAALFSPVANTFIFAGDTSV